jgi:hypothetical protein
MLLSELLHQPGALLGGIQVERDFEGRHQYSDIEVVRQGGWHEYVHEYTPQLHSCVAHTVSLPLRRLVTRIIPIPRNLYAPRYTFSTRLCFDKLPTYQEAATAKVTSILRKRLHHQEFEVGNRVE